MVWFHLMSSLYRLEINQPGQTSNIATLAKLIFCGNVFNNSIYYILNNTCKHHGLCFVHVWSSHSVCHEWDPCLYLYSLISETVSRYLYFPVLHSVRSHLIDVIVCHKVVFSKVLIPICSCSMRQFPLRDACSIYLLSSPWRIYVPLCLGRGTFSSCAPRGGCSRVCFLWDSLIPSRI